jgi:hypothetical protein
VAGVAYEVGLYRRIHFEFQPSSLDALYEPKFKIQANRKTKTTTTKIRGKIMNRIQLPKNGTSTRQWKNGTPKISRRYQRIRKVQRLVMTIPASRTGWIDTQLHPSVIGTRPIACGWHAKVSHNPQTETFDCFRQRISNIRIRFVPDPSVSVNRQCYVYLTNEWTDMPVLPPMAEIQLNAKIGTRLRFPMDPGRIQVRLIGARSSDRGNVCLVFVLSIAAVDDYVIFNDVTNCVEIFNLALDDFPELPPLPEL